MIKLLNAVVQAADIAVIAFLISVAISVCLTLIQGLLLMGNVHADFSKIIELLTYIPAICGGIIGLFYGWKKGAELTNEDIKNIKISPVTVTVLSIIVFYLVFCFFVDGTWSN